jgi:ABC-type polar amino acid transport system ATPase subunit
MSDVASIEEPMIEVRGLHKYFGEHHVLRGIDLVVKPGEVVSIIGPSGCGKSTFLKSLNLLELPTSGTIQIDGQRISFCNTKSRRKRIPDRKAATFRQKSGMVFQQFFLFPHMTVLQNVMEGPWTVKRIPKDECRLIASELLKKVGLSDKMDAMPQDLSGGQQQRVGIARALAMAPKVMLFDEPTSSLDPELVGEVLEVIKVLAAEGMTMLVVTHEITFASNVANKVVFMDQGIIMEQGAPGQVINNPREARTRSFLSKFHLGTEI